MKIAALAGGVGGAKLAQGLALVLPPGELGIIVNTGDDFDHLGMRICPDVDTVCYTLAGLANPKTGWGLADETWNALASLQSLGGPTWFRIGDRDLATHLERTRRLNAGEPLSVVTAAFCQRMGVSHAVLPMTDDRVATIVDTDEGELEFQEYFVHRDCRPRIRSVSFRGAATASPAPGVLERIQAADAIILCPSNPWVSIDPILAVPGIQSAIDPSRTVAVSPIIGGRALKGPAAKMFFELGIRPSAAAVAHHYDGLIGSFVLDTTDAALAPDIQTARTRTLVCKTLMRTQEDRRRLAQDVLDFLHTNLR
jgi:LPPG:FO 2-phospho-L-lactate transferase